MPGDPPAGVLVVLYRGDMFMAEARTDDDGRARLAESLEPGTYRLVFHPPSPFFRRVELEVELERGRSLPRPAPRLSLLVRELPRQLSADELAELFEGRTRLVERLAELEDPLGRAEEVVAGAVRGGAGRGARRAPGDRRADGLSARSAAEQGTRRGSRPSSPSSPYLNQVYEEKFGFRFVVFVDGRPKAEILEVLRERLARTREEELETGVRELVAIAKDRWTRTT